MARTSKKQGYSREYPYLTNKRVEKVREIYRKLGRSDLVEEDDGSWNGNFKKFYRRKPHPYGIKVTDGSGESVADKIARRKKLTGW